ncbi:M48 family metalloprotease [Nocardioides sp. Y6]|uniref:M48 family metalloprotease n=1 Tax=Nocardioides malaquae TaxID=2773426 RepID=A0ABR9RP50_9ACTN|nr:M48 family metalloprotease [Nocardioides malaquae]MBE7323283.1 M48 family metalloprotease [Nocardioides malaquae]
MRTQRRLAVVQTALALCVLAGLALWLVPWASGPGGVTVSPGELFSLDQIAAAEAYSVRARAWSWSSLAVSLLVAALLGFTARGRRLVDRLPGRWGSRVALAVAVFVSAQTLATLGLRVGAWRLRRDVGLSAQSAAGFLRDVAVQWALDVVVLVGLLLLLLGLARRLPRAWTLVGGALAALLVVAVSYVHPMVVEPLFNDFTSLPEGDLRDRISRVAEQEGVSIDDVVVADASRRTTTLNAWVSGFGETRRVVLHDNLVAEVAPDEVMAVVAHELAHARHDDVVVGTALGAVGAVAAVGALGIVLGAWTRRGGRESTDPRVVPLLLACLAFGDQGVAPVQSAVSRAVEVRADTEALCATNDGEAFENVQVRLATRSLSDPTPPSWAHLWWGSHPGVLDRVALARSWRPAELSSRRCR